MAGVIGWLVGNWGTLVQVALTLLSAGSLVTGLTPTPKDDEFVGKARKVLGRVASVTTFADASGTFKLPGQSAAPAEAPLLFKRPKL